MVLGKEIWILGKEASMGTLVRVQVGDKKARVRRALLDSYGHVVSREFLLTDGSWARYHDSYGFPDDSELDFETRRAEPEVEELVIKSELVFDRDALTWFINTREIQEKVIEAEEQLKSSRPHALKLILGLPDTSKERLGNLYGIPFTVEVTAKEEK